jgi:hypothetical protein
MTLVIWEAESLRATAFYNVGTAPRDVGRIWELVTHRRPEQVLSRPSEDIHVAEGPFGGSEKQLQCTARPDKVEWILRSPQPLPNRPIEGLVTIGGLQGVLTPFRDLGAGWLEISSGITRLAFGAVLVRAATDLQDAHQALNTLLPSVELDPDSVSDFSYQVNRRRILSSPAGILVNRISRWSTMQGGSVEFVVGNNTQPQFTHLADHFACRLELDVNTAGGFTNPLDGAQAVTLFGELVGLGQEIAEKGDIP